MEELVNLVSQKTGIPKDKAKAAVEVVAEFLKDKLPDPLAGQVENLLSGKGVSPDLLQGLGGLFGKK